MKENKKFVSPTIYTALRPLLWIVFHAVFWPRVRGKENIPKKGGAVIAGNHVFVLDPFMIGSGTRRCVHFLAKYELFKPKFMNWLLKKGGTIPVHRHRKDHAALEAAEEYLRNGALIALFPESTIIKPDGVRILPFKMGAVKMAYDTGVPIIPVTINGRYIPIFGRISIDIGKPYYIESDDLEAEREKLAQLVCSKLNPPLQPGERIVSYDDNK